MVPTKQNVQVHKSSTFTRIKNLLSLKRSASTEMSPVTEADGEQYQYVRDYSLFSKHLWPQWLDLPFYRSQMVLKIAELNLKSI